MNGRGNIYLSLDHVDSFGSHGLHTAEHIHLTLNLGLVQQIIQGDECTRPPHTSTVRVRQKSQKGISSNKSSERIFKL